MKIALIALSGVRAYNEELTRLGMTLPGFVERSKVIASLPSQYQASYSGYATPIRKSTWSEWKPPHPPPYTIGVEWNAITTSRPPGLSTRAKPSRNLVISSSSRFTAMRSAWKVRVAGSFLRSRVGTARGFLGDRLGQLFLNVASSSGVAAFG